MEFREGSEHFMSQEAPSSTSLRPLSFLYVSFILLSQKSRFPWFLKLVANSYQVSVLRHQFDRGWNLNLNTKVSGKKPVDALGQMSVRSPVRQGRLGKGGSILV